MKTKIGSVLTIILDKSNIKFTKGLTYTNWGGINLISGMGKKFRESYIKNCVIGSLNCHLFFYLKISLDPGLASHITKIKLNQKPCYLFPRIFLNIKVEKFLFI